MAATFWTQTGTLRINGVGIVVLFLVWGGTVYVGMLLGGTQRTPAARTIHAPFPRHSEQPGPYRTAPPGLLAAYQAAMMQQYLTGSQQPFVKADWSKFAPVVSCPEDRPLTTYGKGDGSKLLCDIGGLGGRDGSPCIIYSLGSNGDYQFEQAMLQNTTCNIFTFDCTYDGKSIDPTRHQYRKWCIGSGKGDFRTWDNITQTLNHTYIDLLKMDVEGHEYPVLAGFQQSDPLPGEIAFEIHLNNARFKFPAKTPETPSGLAYVFLHLATLGYAPYAQEINVFYPDQCSEFTFMRFANGGS